MINFTREEIEVMSIYPTDNKCEMLKNLKESLKYIEDPTMAEVVESTLNKVEFLNEDEFATLDFQSNFDERR